MQYHKLTHKTRHSLFGYFFISPLLIGILLVFLPSLFQTIRFSLNDIVVTGTGYTLSWKGIQYYYNALFTDPTFIPLLVQVLKNMLIQLPIILIFSLFIATILNQQFRGRLIARMIFFVPVLLSTGVAGALDASTLSYAISNAVDTGSATDFSGFLEINKLLSSLNFSPALMGIITGAISGLYQTVKASGMQIVIFLAGLQDIDPALYEAASVEGCSSWELFWKITFPMLFPHIVVNTVYTIADYCTTESALKYYLDTISFNQSQFALATAMNVLYLVSLGLIILICFGVFAKAHRHLT